MDTLLAKAAVVLLLAVIAALIFIAVRLGSVGPAKSRTELNWQRVGAVLIALIGVPLILIGAWILVMVLGGGLSGIQP